MNCYVEIVHEFDSFWSSHIVVEWTIDIKSTLKLIRSTALATWHDKYEIYPGLIMTVNITDNHSTICDPILDNNCDQGNNTIPEFLLEMIRCQRPHIYPMFILNISLWISSFLVNVLVLCVVFRKRGAYNSHRYLVINLVISYIVMFVGYYGY